MWVCFSKGAFQASRGTETTRWGEPQCQSAAKWLGFPKATLLGCHATTIRLSSFISRHVLCNTQHLKGTVKCLNHLCVAACGQPLKAGCRVQRKVKGKEQDAFLLHNNHCQDLWCSMHLRKLDVLWDIAWPNSKKSYAAIRNADKWIWSAQPFCPGKHSHASQMLAQKMQW